MASYFYKGLLVVINLTRKENNIDFVVRILMNYGEDYRLFRSFDVG